MIGIYLSGTGNTKHCVEKITELLDKTAAALPLEDTSVIEQIKNNDTIIFGYPTQFSNAPYMVRDFIKANSSLWENKKILCVAKWALSAVTARAARRGFSKNTAQKFWAAYILKCRTPSVTASS